jgi:hypothetical protein
MSANPHASKGIWAIIELAYNKIIVPKFLIIENKRLGFTFRVLQACAGALCAYLIFSIRGYNARMDVSSYNMLVWTDEPAGASSTDVTHCTFADSEYEGLTIPPLTVPVGCKWIPNGEAFASLPDGIFIATYGNDKYVTEGRDVDGNKVSGALKSCAEIEAECTATYTPRADGGCSCTAEFPFFVRNPEKRMVYLNHGFEVASTTDGTQIIRGRSNAAKVDQGLKSDLKQVDGKILTIIEDEAGTECEVGGQSRWMVGADGAEMGDAAGGIGGPLEDWLNCAGVENLDDSVPELTNNEAIKMRLTGAHLFLSLDTLQNTEEGGNAQFITRIRVSHRVEYSSSETVAYTHMYNPKTGYGKFRERIAQGISIHISNKGQFEFFSLVALVAAGVNTLVILQLPDKAILGLAIYGIGLLSQIYYAAQSQRLNITTQFHGAVARYMSSTSSFRAITNQREKITHGMTFAELKKQMKQVFHADLTENGGKIDDDELEQMVRIIMFGLDKGVHSGEDVLEDGDISCDEFIRACGCNEVVRLGQITKFFDDERKRSILEWMFDDTVVDAPLKPTAKGPDIIELMDGMLI